MARIFEPDEADAYPQAARLWEDSVDITVYEGGVEISLGAEGLRPDISLEVREGEISPIQQDQLVRHLLNVRGVVPLSRKADGGGTVAVPCSEPDRATSLELVWQVTDRLRVVWRRYDKAFLKIDQDECGEDTQVSMDGMEAWRLACAVAAVRAWRFRVEERANAAARDLLAELVGREDGFGDDQSAEWRRRPLDTVRLIARVTSRLLELEAEWDEVVRDEASMGGLHLDALAGGPLERATKLLGLKSERERLAEHLRDAVRHVHLDVQERHREFECFHQKRRVGTDSPE